VVPLIFPSLSTGEGRVRVNKMSKGNQKRIRYR